MLAGAGGDGFKLCGDVWDGAEMLSPCRPLLQKSSKLSSETDKLFDMLLLKLNVL